MPEQFDITVSDLETLPGADLQDNDRLLVSRPGAFDKTVTFGDLRSELGGGSLSEIENDIAALQTAVDGKAPTVHTQAISTITGLQPALDGKAPTVHGHAITDVSGLQTALDGKAPSGHGHVISDVSGLNTALAGKLNAAGNAPVSGQVLTATSPTNWQWSNPTGGGGGGSGPVEISDVIGLQTELDGKAPTVHGHVVADVTGLQTALDGKAPTVHGHAISDVTGLQTALDGKASTAVATTSAAGLMSAADKTKLNGVATGATANATDAQLRDRTTHTGTQAIATVTGLQTALDGKAATAHGHVIADVTGLQTALDGKASTATATTSTAGLMSAADKTKLDGVATGATANATDAQLRDRTTHTGTQAIATVTGLQSALDGKLATATNAAAEGLVLTATGASAWEWRESSGSGGGTPVDANGHPVVNGQAPTVALDWRSGGESPWVSPLLSNVIGSLSMTGSLATGLITARRLWANSVGSQRVSFDPVSEVMGLLTARAFSSRVYYNTSTTGWAGTNASVGAPVGNGPNDTANAGIRITSTSAGGYATPIVDASWGTTGNHFCGGFFRAGTISEASLYLTGNNGTNFARVSLNLSTGATAASTGTGAIAPSSIRVFRLSNGWWYFGFVASLPATTAAQVRVAPGGLSGAVGSVDVWGLIAGAGSYVPITHAETGASPLGNDTNTRLFDPTTTPFSPETTLYLEFVPGFALAGTLLAVGSFGGSKPRLEVTRTVSGGIVRVFNASGVQVFSQPIAVTENAVNRLAVAIDGIAATPSARVAINGALSTPTLTTTGLADFLTVSTNCRTAFGTDIDLGDGAAEALICRWLAYPTAFDDANLTALSKGGSVSSGSGGSGGGGGVTLPIAITDVSGLAGALDAKLDDSQLAQPSGVASLDPSGLVPVAQLPIVTPSVAGAMSAADKTKLDGVATGATANATDAQLRDRTTHTGTQAIATVSGLQAALDGKAATAHTHSGADITTGTVATARLGTGTPSAANYLRGDGAWSAVAQSEVTGLVTSLAGKSDVGHTHVAANVTSGTFATARLGSGTANNTAYLRGDSTWQTLNVAAVSGLQAALDAKAALVHTHVISDVTGLQAALDARVLTSSLGASGGVATLDGTGKIPSAQLPALAITEVFTVASEAAMLALTAQTGDLARRTDISRTFILTAEPATTLGNWVEWLIPGDAVTSVAGKTGAVTLAIADTVGLQAALDGKAPTSHTHAAADITSGTFSTARLGSGTANTGAYLRGDSSWQVLNVAAVSGLQAALDAKAALVHTHAAADVTSGIFAVARLGTGTPSAANYLRGDGSWSAIAQSEVTGLVTSLAGKSDTGHTHAASDITSGVLSTARLGTGTPSAANYLRGDGSWAAIAQSEVAGLVTALSGKLDTTARGTANGVASLDASTLVPSTQIPTLALSKLDSTGATTNQVVTFNGSAIVWASAAGGNLTWTARSTNATIAANENTFAKSGVTTLTLPSSISGAHRIANRSGAAITVQTQGGALIDGFATSATIASNTEAVLIADAGVWRSVNATVLIAAQSFSYTGANQSFIVPNAIGARLFFYGVGAGGGGGSAPGGGGGAVCIVLEIAASTDLANGRIAQGATLIVVVGQGGVFNGTSVTYGGGGPSGSGGAGSGGGLTGLFLSSFTFPNALGIAGAGGGAANAASRIGGAGGGIAGENSTGDIPGTGGTQSAGGTSGSGSGGTAAGQLAGASATGTSYAGGGSGYYGGGAGLGAAGGSGYRLPAAFTGSAIYSGSGQTSGALYFPALFSSSVGRGGNASSNGSNGAARIEVIPA